MSSTVPDRLQGHIFLSYASADRARNVRLAALFQASVTLGWIGQAGIQRVTSWRQRG